MSIYLIPTYFYTNLLPRTIRNNSWASFNLKHYPTLLDLAVIITWDMRRMHHYGKQGTLQTFRRSLGRNLFSFMYLGCKDPRDRIFAILGISSDAKQLGIVPNYQISDREIFIDLSIQIYSFYQEFFFLENIGCIDNLSDSTMPSWAYRDAQKVEMPISISSPHPLSKIRISFEDQNMVLVARGRVVEVVITTSSPVLYSTLSTTGEVIVSDIDFRKGFLVCYTTILGHIGTSLETISSLVHACITDISWPSYDDTVETAFYFWCSYIDLAIELVERDTAILETPWFSQKVIPILKQICKILKREGRDVYDDLQTAITVDIRRTSNASTTRMMLRGRSLSITKHGGICNSSGKTREGDVVAILAGAKAPYVLRPVGDKYQFVGDIWMEGLMNGAAYKDVKPEDVDYEIRLI